MRTELLIIVAIIFLCSWCVYILVKMNGSVENSYQNSKNQASANRAIGSDFAFDTSKSIHHGVNLDPPYQVYSNISENPFNYSDISSLNNSHLSNTTLANIEDEYYEEDYPVSLVQNNQNSSMHNASRIREKFDDHVHHLPGLPDSNLVDIDVTRPTSNKDNYHRSELQSKHYQKKDVSRKKTGQSSANNGSRFPYSQNTAVNDGHIGSQASASNQLKSFNDPDSYDKKILDYDADRDNDDAKNGDDDSGTEIDERSGGTSYNEQENIAHDKGHKYSLSPDTNYRKTGGKNTDDVPNKVDSEEYEYEDDPVVAATNVRGVNPADIHAHKMKESVVSQRWDDVLDNENERFTGAKSNERKNNAKNANNNDNENDIVRFLDLDKRRTPFHEKRFKRYIDDNQKYQLEGENIPQASINSLYSPGIRVQLPNLANNNMSISATLNPFQTAHINLLPGGTKQSQYIGYPERRPTRVRRRRKRKFDKINRSVGMDIIPVENHQTGIQPEYIVEGQDRATQPSRHHSKNKKKHGHKSKKSSLSGKHSKLQTSQNKKISKSYKKGRERKKKHKVRKDKYNKNKMFQGMKRGEKHRKGHGAQGGKKGMKHYKDKGYKKNGFKNTYHKEEFGNRKTYFDEYRDKDFKKKYNKFDDKYKYNKMKKWSGKDQKKMKKVKDFGKKHHKSGNVGWKKKHIGKSKKEHESQEHSAKKKSVSKKI